MDNEPIGRNLLVAASRIRRYLDNQYLKHGVTLGQGRVMRYVEVFSKDGNVYQKDIENSLGIRGSSVNSLVDGIVKMGYLTRVEDENDRRQKVLKLTKTGLLLTTELTSRVIEFENFVESKLTQEEKDHFLQVIKKLESIIDLKESSNV